MEYLEQVPEAHLLTEQLLGKIFGHLERCPKTIAKVLGTHLNVRNQALEWKEAESSCWKGFLINFQILGMKSWGSC